MEFPWPGSLRIWRPLVSKADGTGIADFGAVLEDRITAIQQQITEAVGYAFNLNSPKQLAVALFEDLGLPAKKKTKTGYSTSADVLESLRNAHPVVEMLLDYRTLSKLKSTYCDGLLKVIRPDGRIPSFNQTETRTGRISSTEPNLQNIPVRQELGRELRRFFRAGRGGCSVTRTIPKSNCGFSPTWRGPDHDSEAFNTGADIHRITASQVFGVPEEMVTPLMRSRAKAVNFGIVYGIGAHSLSQDIHVSYAEAKTYIEEYLRHYGAVAGFMDRLIEEAKACGYAKTLYGRRRPLPELRASNRMTRSFGERGGAQHADPGHGRGYHQTRHGAGAPPAVGGGDAGPIDPAGARRADRRGAGGGSRSAPRPCSKRRWRVRHRCRSSCRPMSASEKPGTTPKGKPAGRCGIFGHIIKEMRN